MDAIAFDHYVPNKRLLDEDIDEDVDSKRITVRSGTKASTK
jgi:hypothetical protein